MKTIAALSAAAIALVFAPRLLAVPVGDVDAFGTGVNQFAIEFVPIGNPNNPDDIPGNPSPVGKVEYSYRIGKFEISEDMINKANTLGGLGITGSNHGANKPVTYMSWYEAATFVNWLNESTGHQRAYNFDNSGNFQIWPRSEAWQKGGENLFRHKDAYYFLPSRDEWYKAAYYDANAGVYYDYPTGSDTAPIPIAAGTGAGTAVYGQPGGQGAADITLAGGLSPYGTMAQGGNVGEWDETDYDLMNTSALSDRGIVGGHWTDGSETLLASRRDPASPPVDLFGFRVASRAIPEPSTLLLTFGVAGGFVVWRLRA